jgi:hypothetical protein
MALHLLHADARYSTQLQLIAVRQLLQELHKAAFEFVANLRSWNTDKDQSYTFQRVPMYTSGAKCHQNPFSGPRGET